MAGRESSRNKERDTHRMRKRQTYGKKQKRRERKTEIQTKTSV